MQRWIAYLVNREIVNRKQQRISSSFKPITKQLLISWNRIRYSNEIV